jgi:hypothetical protein
MKLTRRQLAAVVSATAISRAHAHAQAQAPADELQAARERLKANSDLLAKLELPASTEPAFRFKA